MANPDYKLPFINAYWPMRNLARLANKTENGVAFSAAFIMSKAGDRNGDNIFHLTPETKNRIMKDTGLTWGTIKNALSSLVAKGVIMRLGRGIYQVNPILFSKGKGDDILEMQMKWLKDFGNLEMNKLPELWKNQEVLPTSNE